MVEESEMMVMIMTRSGEGDGQENRKEGGRAVSEWKGK